MHQFEYLNIDEFREKYCNRSFGNCPFLGIVKALAKFENELLPSIIST